MSFEAIVYKVLIASPGDVSEERVAIPEVIARWNTANSEANKIVLLPVKWETHSAPLMGDRPQGVINEQLVRSCDMLVGVFWTRLGSPTGASESGTAEEIEMFINSGKPTMVYFSSRSIDPAKLDIDQWKSLKEFEKKMQKIGLTGAYSDITDFKEQLLNQISINVRNLMAGVPISKPTAKELKEKISAIQEITKTGKVFIEDYEKNNQIKSFLVKGDSKPIKDQLKEMGGRWNGTLNAWIFPKTKEIAIVELLKKIT